MQFAWRSIFVAGVLGASSVAVGLVACTSSGDRPAVGDELNPGVVGSYEAGTNDANQVVPGTCGNKTKDGKETDVDCGGTECAKCVDGKTCLAKTDCAGDACLDGKCATPACTDNRKDGDETDIDCGGKICAKCLTGQRCAESSDCVSAACDTGSHACACPQGMISIPRQGGGGSYCIDIIEVTKYQYGAFIAANVAVSAQDPICKDANQSFLPRNAWGISTTAPTFTDTTDLSVTTNFNGSLPIHYVDWCDAYAYCKWAGKQLCGSVHGGSVPFDKATQADSSAWYNACSVQGENPYPYGKDYLPGVCNGGSDPDLSSDVNCGPEAKKRSGYGCSSNHDEGINELVDGDKNGHYTKVLFADCAAGPTGPYQMTGNVAEWEDSCDGTGANANCHVRGGSHNSGNTAEALRCDVNRTEQRVPSRADDEKLADIGFRCCIY
jgi:formylglycine-generating enzyme required for sulfatase activity